MSGEKRRTVRIDEQRKRELEQQESRLRSLQRDLPDRLNDIQEQARRDLQQRLSPLEERTKRQEQENQKLRSNLRDLEKNTQKRLQQQRKDLEQAISASEKRQQQNLKSEVSRLESAMESGFQQQRQEYLQLCNQQRQEYLHLFSQQDEKFTNLIEAERKEREEIQEILQQQIDDVAADVAAERQRKRQLATDLLADVEQIYQQIDRDYQHERFTPGQLQDLYRGIELAKSNLKNDIPESAISNSQQTYLQLADLRLALERKEQQWNLLYNAAWQDLQNLIAEVRANRECEIVVGEGDEAESFQLEVDYWVEGRLSEYERELQQLQKRLETEASTLTIEQVEQLGEQIQQQQPRLGEIVEQAKLAILSSQMRVEIADRVVETLSQMGYSLENPDRDAVYEGEDQRNTYVVKLKNIAGDEVVTTIAPGKDWGSNTISINTFNETLVDEGVADQNSQAIFGNLEAEGVKGEGEVERRQQPNTDYRDMQQVRQRQKQQQQATGNQNERTKDSI